MKEQEVLDFDEMYEIETIHKQDDNFYQVHCPLGPYRLMEQIKAEREYLINELVDINYNTVEHLTRGKVFLRRLSNDSKIIRDTIRFEILEELQSRYDTFITKCKEEGELND